jgi:C4-dicarboxylate transporter DctM subunit
MEAGLVGIACLLIIAFVGVPLGFAMMAVGFVGFALLRNWVPASEMVGQQLLYLGMNQSFAVLPLFIMMGVFVSRSGLSDDLYEASNTCCGHFRGGLAVSTIVACGGFSAISGSSVATAATMAKVAIPSMRRFGYADSLAAGTVAAGGTLGILIPPSTALIIYGLLTETDIAKLFVAGIIPGLMTIAIYIAVVVVITCIHPDLGPRAVRASWKERKDAVQKIWGVIVLFVVIMGGIFFGVFTPSEAGGIGAVGALAFAVARRKMTWRIFFESLIEGGRLTATLFSVAFGALVLNQFINIAGLPEDVVRFIASLELAPLMVLVIILGFFVVLGMVIEGISMILLTVPIFVPVVQVLGIDLIWFGILMIVVVEVSLITPPIGLNVFVLKSMLPDVELSTIFRGIIPFFIADLIRLALFVAFPPLVLFLPSLML